MDKSSQKTRQFKTSEEMLQRRRQLMEYSQQAEQIREAEGKEDETINGILKTFFYDTENVLTFNTFHQWKKRGYTIKKGAKAFLFWGQPVDWMKRREGEEPEQQHREGEGAEEEKYKYWPVCCLFSNEQVVKVERSRKTAEMQEVVEEEEEFLEF